MTLFTTKYREHSDAERAKITLTIGGISGKKRAVIDLDFQAFRPATATPGEFIMDVLSSQIVEINEGDNFLPADFRNEIMRNGVVLFRNVLPASLYSDMKTAVFEMLAHYERFPTSRLAELVQTATPEDRGFWQQVALGHLFDKEFLVSSIGKYSYFDFVEKSPLKTLLYEGFPDYEIRKSTVSNSRRVDPTTSREVLWDGPIGLHVDAQFHFHHVFGLNFWVPLNACGVDAPGLQFIPMAPTQAEQFLDYSMEGHPPKPTDIANMRHFRTERLEPAALAESGLLPKIVKPQMNERDVIVFSNKTIHGTNYSAGMSHPRTSLEVRFDMSAK